MEVFITQTAKKSLTRSCEPLSVFHKKMKKYEIIVIYKKNQYLYIGTCLFFLTNVPLIEANHCYDISSKKTECCV